jgi:hypothetical protein
LVTSLKTHDFYQLEQLVYSLQSQIELSPEMYPNRSKLAVK